MNQPDRISYRILSKFVKNKFAVIGYYVSLTTGVNLAILAVKRHFSVMFSY